MTQPTRRDLCRAAVTTLRQAGVPDAVTDARRLMAWAADLSSAQMAGAEGECPEVEEVERYLAAIARRAEREPVSHIIGHRMFWGRAFEVNAHVLDPRPETEVLIAEALNRGPFQRVLDLGTGSGCLLLTLVSEWPQATGVGTDNSAEALDVAKCNAEQICVGERAAFQRSDWLEGIEGVFDLIVSNPPYIAADEMADLSPEVRGYEPLGALTPGGDGLDAYRAIADGSARHLTEGGLLMVEIGPSQPEMVSVILASAGWIVRAIIPDLDQRARVIVAGL